MTPDGIRNIAGRLKAAAHSDSIPKRGDLGAAARLLEQYARHIEQKEETS